MKRYLLFVSLSYSYSILRPIQTEIRKRGDDVAWFIEDGCTVRLRDGEKRLLSIKDVMEYNPLAIFAPGNYIYDFFPGIKVEVFHGLFFKRTDYGDHYRIRGLFDLYCVTSSMFMPEFKRLEEKYGFFRVVETGWSKFDAYVNTGANTDKEGITILYAPTFTESLSSTVDLYNQIERLLQEKDWKWVFSFHPKMKTETIEQYRALADRYDNALYSEEDDKLGLFTEADLMVSDTSSVIYEFLWFDKPVVTYKNTFPENHLLDIQNANELESAIEKAISRPADLLENISKKMDEVHSFRDGKSSARILDAVDDFVENYKGKIKKKPLNLFRKLKLRRKAGYFPFGPRYKVSE
ncbi:CDP-glycerol glycerophosphotransferase family protein [Dysgonomonas macrotermitis]|uniref:CDP-glycerol glycerophosphotransferase, TagB/SpsB family n=1 Tax=Dysgonomonas macrotermitis TaxID=1346286 RepID=A0A1M5HV22_9BACT|nr:CDP-glycerol glycerophosphotransferase family protein [Dysgonomonas macrotermitis]SHG19824.1 CDP-glycerol glycerophosphotransferase, TagB/SpsB family [Dysgonomonas macrotermitis]